MIYLSLVPIRPEKLDGLSIWSERHTGKTHTSNKAIFSTTGWLLLWGFSHLSARSFLVSCCLYLSLCSEYRIRSVCPCLFLQAELATAQSWALRCHPRALDFLICMSHSCKFRLLQSPDAKHSTWFLMYNRFQAELEVSSLHIFHLSMTMNGVYPQGTWSNFYHLFFLSFPQTSRVCHVCTLKFLQ